MLYILTCELTQENLTEGGTDVNTRLEGGNVQVVLSPKEVQVFCRVFTEFIAAEQEDYDNQLSSGTISSGTDTEELLENAQSMLEDMEAMNQIVNSSDEDEDDEEEC